MHAVHVRISRTVADSFIYQSKEKKKNTKDISLYLSSSVVWITINMSTALVYNCNLKSDRMCKLRFHVTSFGPAVLFKTFG